MRLASVVACLAAAIGCTRTGPPQQCPSLARPSARSQVSAVLVPADNQIYVFGGQGAQLPRDDLWRYSFGSCGGWTQLRPTSMPGPRANYAAAFDSKRSRIVYIGDGSRNNDVWALDTNLLQFKQLQPGGTPPLVAAAEVAAYDDMHDRVIYAGVESYALDFSKNDDGVWSVIDGTTVMAPASATVDPSRSLMLVLDSGGLHGFSFLTGTWRDLTGTTPAAGAVILWDPIGRELLAVGDEVSRGALDANGTAVAFTPLPTTNAPPPRSSFAAALSGTVLWLSGGVTASGCTLDDLWTLELGTGAWTNVWPATTCQGLPRTGGPSQAERGAAAARNDEGAGRWPATEE